MPQEQFVGLDLGHKTTIAYRTEDDRVERIPSDPREVERWLNEVCALEHRPVLLAESPWDPLVQGALNKGLSVETVNPFKLSRFRSAITSGDAKDDVRDAKAEVAFRRACPQAFRELRKISQDYGYLRTLLTDREDCVADAKRVENRLRDILRMAFPMLLERCSDALDRVWLLEVLDKAPTSLDVAQIDSEKSLRKLRKKLKVQTTEQLRELLAVNPALEDGALAEALRDKIRWQACQLRNLTARARRLRRNIETFLDEIVEKHEGETPGLVEILRSFPNAGPIITAQILVEESGLLTDELPDRAALRAHSGVRPITRQSGGTRIVTMRRARSIRLNNAMIMLASVAMQRSPKVLARYRGLRARGKPHQTALRATASSILDTLHAMWTHRTLYIEPGGDS